MKDFKQYQQFISDDSVHRKLEHLANDFDLIDPLGFSVFAYQLNLDRLLFIDGINHKASISKQISTLKKIEAHASKTTDSISLLLSEELISEKPSHADAAEQFFSAALEHLVSGKSEKGYFKDILEQLILLQKTAFNGYTKLEKLKKKQGRTSNHSYKHFLSNVGLFWKHETLFEYALEHDREHDSYSGKYFDFVLELHNVLYIECASEEALGRNIQRSFEWMDDKEIVMSSRWDKFF